MYPQQFVFLMKPVRMEETGKVGSAVRLKVIVKVKFGRDLE